MRESEAYYVVIFTSKKTNDLSGYAELDEKLFELVKEQEGFIDAESFSNTDGRDITIVSFKTEENLLSWKNNALHKEAQIKGKEQWYEHYNVKVCRVEREYEFNKS